jgi:MFS transporter, DHA1 family, tetracycline resistance protein
MGESVTDKIRRPFTWKRANPFGAFRSVFNLPGIRPLLLVYFLYNIALYVYPSIWSYFTQERFGWTPQIIGVSLALFGISMAIVQGVMIRLVLRWFGERRTVIWGHLFDFGAFGIISVVTSGTIALILTPVSALGAVVTPALQGIMSRMVDDNAQGELQGVLTSVTALAMIISPLVMTSVFAFFTREGTPFYLPGAPFMVSSVLILIGLVVFARCAIPDPDA